jgi:hypothetical protein
VQRPRERGLSGVLFCGVQALSPATQILLECVTQQPHCSNIFYLAEEVGTNDILGLCPKDLLGLEELSGGAQT